MKDVRLRLAAASAMALCASGCAQVTAADADLPAPALNVQLSATAANGPFSSIPGTVTVQSVALTRRNSAVPNLAFVNSASSGHTVTFTFTPSPGEFVNGDVLTVTWSADAVSLLGSHYTVLRSATYSFHGRVGK